MDRPRRFALSGLIRQIALRYRRRREHGETQIESRRIDLVWSACHAVLDIARRKERKNPPRELINEFAIAGIEIARRTGTPDDVLPDARGRGVCVGGCCGGERMKRQQDHRAALRATDRGSARDADLAVRPRARKPQQELQLVLQAIARVVRSEVHVSKVDLVLMPARIEYRLLRCNSPRCRRSAQNANHRLNEKFQFRSPRTSVLDFGLTAGLARSSIDRFVEADRAAPPAGCQVLFRQLIEHSKMEGESRSRHGADDGDQLRVRRFRPIHGA